MPIAVFIGVFIVISINISIDTYIDVILDIVVIFSANSTKKISKLYSSKSLLLNYYIIKSFSLSL